MVASKDNKVYQITESQKQDYINSGYDIYDDNGEVIAYGRGKTVPYEEYIALRKELEVLKKKSKNSKPGKGQDDNLDIELGDESNNVGGK